MLKTVVQIGLNKTAEYVPLVTGARQPSTGALPQQVHWIPMEVRQGTWRYFGIDADPSSIHEMLSLYDPHPNIHFMNVCVGETAGIVERVSWFFMGKRHYVSCFPLHDLLDALQIEQLEVLAIDIEGAELPVLAAFSWEIQPEFLAVESHHEQHTELESLVVSKGYYKIMDVPTNNGHTREMHFSLA